MARFDIAGMRHPLSLAGAVLTTASAILILTLFAFEVFGFVGNPYIGIITYLILPVFFIGGLLLIPAGFTLWHRRVRKAAAEGRQPPAFPVIDFNRMQTRKLGALILLLTIVNVVILASATYKGVEVMDSAEFCGSCHSVMEPEFTAYQNSPHARVECVDCHIGPGASWFVKSKLSGLRQVVAVAFDLYPRPIPTPIHDLRPARETCQQCHWPEKFVGDRLKVITDFEEDEQNTDVKTVLLLRIGGIEGRKAHGIHWHVDPQHRIRYLSDETRETVYQVELIKPDGGITVYKHGEPPEEGGTWRVMDCVDCHNRPTHIYKQPKRAIAQAIQEGRIDRTLPFIMREGLAAITSEYSSHEQARQEIAAAIDRFYEQQYPDLFVERKETIRQASHALGEVYAQNVFPTMNVSWGTYPDHIGHEFSSGCFRCHSDEHATDAGEVISQDCATCHTLLAWQEAEPEVFDYLRP